MTRGNTATHPPNYFINGQQRQRTANSANLYNDPTYRLHSLQTDQQRTLPYGGYNTSDFSLLHLYSYRVNIDIFVIQWRYAYLLHFYDMIWYGICMLWYAISMLCYEILKMT